MDPGSAVDSDWVVDPESAAGSAVGSGSVVDPDWAVDLESVADLDWVAGSGWVVVRVAAAVSRCCRDDVCRGYVQQWQCRRQPGRARREQPVQPYPPCSAQRLVRRQLLLRVRVH